MNKTVSDDILRATILAGTLPLPNARQVLPEAWSPHVPEPGWFERRFAFEAQRTTTMQSFPEVQPPAPGMPVHRMGVSDLLGAYKTGAVEPIDAVQTLMARLHDQQTKYNAMLAPVAGWEMMAQESRDRYRAGTARLLEGVPFGVKDIIDVKGTPVTGGSRLTGKRVAEVDACIVARLRSHGAIPLAMLATTEFASGSAHNPRYGAVRNPWNAERWTGGSSTGSGAALAARLLPLALGSDTGGSIRVPASWCGITGLKPTRGLVPRTGVIPLSWSFDHIGPMARSASDLACVMAIIAGPDGLDPIAAGQFAGSRARRDLKNLRIGVPDGWFLELQDDAVLMAWREALRLMEALGAMLVPVRLGEIETAHRDGYLALMCELASLQESNLGRLDEFDAGTRARIEQGVDFTALDYLRAMRARPLVTERVLEAMADVDVVITPGLGSEAAFLEDMTVEVNGTRHPLQLVIPRNTMIFDYTGLPALMLPSGFGRNGLPVAIQIVGKPFDDALCLSIGQAFQAATTHHVRAPAGV
jgi:aspartyl-tRNA(Asn)/glutamyl-tRNA(Gln) amidotransferase subunit A